MRRTLPRVDSHSTGAAACEADVLRPAGPVRPPRSMGDTCVRGFARFQRQREASLRARYAHQPPRPTQPSLRPLPARNRAGPMQLRALCATKASCWGSQPACQPASLPPASTRTALHCTAALACLLARSLACSRPLAQRRWPRFTCAPNDYARVPGLLLLPPPPAPANPLQLPAQRCGRDESLDLVASRP